MNTYIFNDIERKFLCDVIRNEVLTYLSKYYSSEPKIFLMDLP